MYNARDVIRRCLPQCGIPEWSDTNMLDHVWNLISANRDSFDPEFGRLFDGKKVVMELLPETEMYPGIVHPADLYYMEDVFSLMVHAGYLGYSNWKLYIPGKRIREYLTLRYHIETDAKAAS